MVPDERIRVFISQTAEIATEFSGSYFESGRRGERKGNLEIAVGNKQVTDTVNGFGFHNREVADGFWRLTAPPSSDSCQGQPVLKRLIRSLAG